MAELHYQHKLTEKTEKGLGFIWTGPEELPTGKTLMWVKIFRTLTQLLFLAVVIIGLVAGYRIWQESGSLEGFFIFGASQAQFWLAAVTSVAGFFLYKRQKLHLHIPETLTGNEKIDLYKTLAPETISLLGKMQQLSSKINKKQLDSDLVIQTLFDTFPRQIWLLRMGVAPTDIDQLVDSDEPSNTLELTQISLKLFEKAFISAYRTGSHMIHPEDLFFAAHQLDKKWQDFFRRFGLSGGDIKEIYNWWKVSNNRHRKRSKGFSRLIEPSRNINRLWTSRPTQTLSLFSRDLTELAELGRLPHTKARQEETNQVIEILARAQQNNVLLVGQQGVGKDIILGKIAYEMEEDRVPRKLKDKKLLALDTNKIIANAKRFGGIEPLVSKIIEEAASSGNIVLYVPQTESLTSEESGIGNLASILAPVLEKSGTQFIGTTTPDHYTQYIESNQRLKELFDKIEVDSMDIEEAIPEVARQTQKIEANTSVLITYKALIKAVELTDEFRPNESFPAKAVRLLDKAASNLASNDKHILKAHHVIGAAEREFEIPIETAKEKEGQELLNLEDEIYRQYINQEKAVESIANSLRRSRAGLHEEKRPMGSFLFTGPTGVGKTELAKRLAEVYFGSEDKMIRLDMSEFQDEASTRRLLGAPVGSERDQGGQFTEAVKEDPFSLILLDELEKAHESILDLFLQVFEDGRLTDTKGETVDFRKTIIIATSNVGANMIADRIEQGDSYEQIREDLERNMREYLRIEFLNRFDDILVFTPLSKEEIKKIAELMIQDVQQEISDQEIEIKLTDEAYNRLVNLGYDPKLGARPLRRAIQDHIESPLAEEILSQGVEAGEVIEITKEDLPES